MPDGFHARWLGWLGVCALASAAACGSNADPAPGGEAGRGQAGAGADSGGGAGKGSGGTAGKGGASPCGGAGAVSGRGGNASSGEGGAAGDQGGAAGAAGQAESGAGGAHGGVAGDDGNGGAAGAPSTSPLEALLSGGELACETAARPAYGAVVIAAAGERVFAVESRRDVETGPFNLPWRTRFRLAVYASGQERWVYAAEPDDVISDVVVHPSGDVTIALLRHPPERESYDLLRFDGDGTLRRVTPLGEPTTIPSGDFGSWPNPLFRMKSDFSDATAGGWVRLLPDGEGLMVAFLSYVDVPETDPLRLRLALGVGAYGWEQGTYVERWARVVDGPHAAQPAAWAYDELRWREQAMRPFLTRDSVNGDVLVGRAWNSTRCESNLAVFAEFDAEDCVLGSVNPLENERLPLAVTRFDSAGARLGTIVLAPDEDAAEQVPFALVAHGGELAVAGSVVRELSDGTRRTYPDGDGFVDYDGYIAVYDAGGELVRHRDFNQGRGDVLAALVWTGDGFVAAGSSGWDRWQGGMSISRGADPWLVWMSEDAERSVTRVAPLSDGSRHYSLHDVAVTDGSIVAAGFADAPMTHSADGGNHAARTFGSLRVRVTAP